MRGPTGYCAQAISVTNAINSLKTKLGSYLSSLGGKHTQRSSLAQWEITMSTLGGTASTGDRLIFYLLFNQTFQRPRAEKRIVIGAKISFALKTTQPILS
jgi:hypothetical protein